MVMQADTVTEILPLLVDGLLILLLIGAIAACTVVYRRLDDVRKGQSEMTLVVDQLNKAVNEAETSVHSLKATATQVGAGLNDQVKEARALRDELALITEAGNNLADRIERGVSSGKQRQATASQDPQQQATAQGEPVTDKPSLEGKKQRDLMSALKQAR